MLQRCLVFLTFALSATTFQPTLQVPLREVSMNYWHGSLATRLTRRRALAGAGSGLAAAAFLAACGGGSSGGTKPEEKDASGLLTKPQNTTSSAKQGGTFPYFVQAEVIT